MLEAQGFGVQGVARHDVEGIFHKLLVLAVDGPFEDMVAAVFVVVEDGVAQVFHVDADLVGPAGFEVALHHADVVEAFEHLVMGDGPFALFTVRKGGELFAVARVAADMGARKRGETAQAKPAKAKKAEKKAAPKKTKAKTAA